MKSAEVVNNGIWNNLPVASKAIYDAIKINNGGEPKAGIKGKGRSNTAKIEPIEPWKHFTKREVPLEADIMYIDKLQFLISVSKEFAYMMLSYIGESISGARLATTMWPFLQ